MKKIGIIGAGAWGTALAITARRAGRQVVLWAREEDTVVTINTDHRNPAYLPGVDLDPAIHATTDPATAANADAVFLVSPAQFLRPVCRALAPYWKKGTPAVVCAKGVENGTLALMSEVAAEELPGVRLAVLSGPTFAAEVAQGLPTALTLACADSTVGALIQQAIAAPTFRTYLSDDVIGAQVGGAVKNVIAIACGVATGKGMGDNTRAALITRGLAEIARLAKAMGGQSATLMGLSGLGDLILTANSLQSRNYSLGVALGEGKSLAEILGARRSVAEGVFSAEAVMGLAHRHGVDMPICEAADAVLNRGQTVDEVIHALLSRPFRAESI